MPPAEYLDAGYYERWLWSAERRLERKGTIAPGEVEAMMERLRAGEAAAAARGRPSWRSGSSALLGDAALHGRGRRRALRARRPRARAAHAARGPHPLPALRPRRERASSSACTASTRLPDLAVYGEPAEPEPVYAVAFTLGRALGRRGDEPPFTVVLDLWESYLEEAA